MAAAPISATAGATTGTTVGKISTGDEITAEFDSESLARGHREIDAADAGVAPKQHVAVSWAARTDMGRVRDNNEDKFDFFLPDEPALLAKRGRLWAVADGMGGHDAGQVASEAALKGLVRAYFSDRSDLSIETALQNAVGYANGLLWQASQDWSDGPKMMGTTLVIAVVSENNVIVAHVGDSRAYLLRAGEPLRALTSDHSWVEEQIRRGRLTRAQAEQSPHRNIITRSIGMEGVVKADILAEPLRVGDTLLLCSDGLSGYLTDEKMARILAQNGSPSQVALDLVDAANDAGGGDNITALIVSVRRIADYSEAATVL